MSSIHSASRFQPQDYEFQDTFHTGFAVGDGDFYEDMEVFDNLPDDALFGGPLQSRNGYLKCGVCGQRHKQGALWLHRPSQQFVIIGRQCTDKYLGLQNWSKLDRFIKRGGKLRGEYLARLKRWSELRKFARGLSKDVRQALKRDHRIVRDIREKLIRFGSISEKQQALVVKIASQPVERKAPCPSGKTTIVGQVVKAEERRGYDEVRRVMTVKVTTDEGIFLVWGTCPRSLPLNDLKGKNVSFNASVTPSDRDKSFGFFKRPTKAQVI